MHAIRAIFLSLTFVFQGQALACSDERCSVESHSCHSTETSNKTSCCCDETPPFDYTADCQCQIESHTHRGFFQLSDGFRTLVPEAKVQDVFKPSIKRTFSRNGRDTAAIEARIEPKVMVRFNVWRL